MKKFIIFVYLLSNNPENDFCSSIVKTLNNSINKIPTLTKTITSILKSPYLISSGVISSFVLSYFDYRTIPFFRSFAEIRKTNKLKRVLLLHNKMLESNNLCLDNIIYASIKHISGGDDKKLYLEQKLKSLSTNDMILLLYPLKKKIKKNRSFNELVAFEGEGEGDEKEVIDNCILLRILKKIDQESLSFFDIDNILLHIKYFIKLVPNILELILLLSFGTFTLQKSIQY